MTSLSAGVAATPPARLSGTSGSSDVDTSQRGPSTDIDRNEGELSSYSASSPSTGFTSVYDDAEGQGGNEDSDGEVQPFSSNVTGPVKSGKESSSPERQGASHSRWRMPFTKSSNPPRGVANETSVRTEGETISWRSPKASMRISQENPYGTTGFVETTSAQAAHAMAQYWNDVRRQGVLGKGKGRAPQDEGDYVVVTGVVNGKKIYRIRPRSRPSTSHADLGLARPEVDSGNQALPRVRSMRISRSIPNLRSKSAQASDISRLRAIERDGDGFYRTTGASASPFLMPPADRHHLLPSNEGAPSRVKSPLNSAASIPNLRTTAIDGDVFGRLIGWSFSTPPEQVYAAGTGGTAGLSPSLERKGESFTTASTHIDAHEAKGLHIAESGDALQTLEADLPTDLLGEMERQHKPRLGSPVLPAFSAGMQSLPMQRAVTDGQFSRARLQANKSSSPFGDNVRLPSAHRAKRRKSAGETPSPTSDPTVAGVATAAQTSHSDAVSPSPSGDSIVLLAHADNTAPEDAHVRTPSPIEDEQCLPRNPLSSSQGQKALRETASSETIRTTTYISPEEAMSAKTFVAEQEAQPHTPVAASKASKKSKDSPQIAGAESAGAALDMRLFDVFQALEGLPQSPGTSSSRVSLAAGEGNRQHRGMSTVSLASTTASLVSGSSQASNPDNAHDITVTSHPGDDPRFVIWGVKATAAQRWNYRQQQRQQSNTQTPTLDVEGSAGSPLLSSGMGSNAGSLSKKWGAAMRRNTVSELSPPLPQQSPPNRVLMASTIERWIAEMTSKIESDLMTDFFLTYRSFLAPSLLCQLLITRFEWGLQGGDSPEDIAGRRIVRVRTYVVIRYWLLNYFHEDFVPDRDLRVLLTDWLNSMGKDSRLRSNSTDLRLIKSLKKVVKKLKQAYSTLGAEDAADANRLIATSSTANVDQQTVPRLRSATCSSTASFDSVAEEEASSPQKSPKQAKGSSTGFSDGLKASTGTDTVQQDGARLPHHQKLRTSSSEDDVDLDLELQGTGYDSDDRPVSLPRIIPISPPRPRNTSPRMVLRSPHAMEKSPKMLSAFPIQSDSNRLSKMLNFGKLKRMMGTKSPSAGQSSRSYSLSPEPEGSVKLGRELSYGMGSTDTMQKLAEATPFASAADVTDTVSPNSVTGGLGISGVDAVAQPVSTAPSAHSKPDPPNLHHTLSSQTIRTRSRSGSSALRKSRQASSEGVKMDSSAYPLAPAVEIDDRPIVQFDDYDSSDDESNYGPARVVRTIRRLPAARDLRNPLNATAPTMQYRHSIDTISSYGTQFDTRYAAEEIQIQPYFARDSGDSAFEHSGEDAHMAGGVVPFFVPFAESDDDDEPGDVQAALRRLEGQVDVDRQKVKARKVEEYLKKTKEAEANGGYLNPDEDAEACDNADSISDYGPVLGDEDQEIAQNLASDISNQASLLSDASLSKQAPAVRVEDTSDEPRPSVSRGSRSYSVASLRPTRASDKLSPRKTALSNPQLPDETARAQLQSSPQQQKRKTVQRKSSIRRFFASRTSTAARPEVVPPSSSKAHSRPTDAADAPQRCFLFDVKSDVIARHFCLIERDLFEKVTWQELVSGEWRDRSDQTEVLDWTSYLQRRAFANAAAQADPDKAQRKGDVQAIIQRFNLMCNWIASEIVSVPRLEARAVLIDKIIKLAFRCYRMYNFQTLTQLIHGLQSPHVERLTKTWAKVKNIKLYEQLKSFCSHLQNFRALREATDVLAEQWGPPGQDAGVEIAGVPGAIPFFGLVLRDLAVSSELPTFLDPSSPRAPATVSDALATISEYADPAAFTDLPQVPSDLPIRPLINVHKYRTIASIIQKVMSFKELANSYPYEGEAYAYKKCLKIQCLPPQKIAELSLRCQ